MQSIQNLNPQQQEAVLHYEGPLLILAGAGSGKTSVLTHRVTWLIEEKGVNPWNIMAITFTNKAAGEMRERVKSMLPYGAESVWVSTFHSTCVRILRRFIDRIGYNTNFTIYDADDQKTVIKDIIKRMNLDSKQYKERFFMSAISSAKDELVSPTGYSMRAMSDFRMKKVADVYTEYQKQLRENNALDFDDLIFKTVELFQSCPDVLEYFQDKFRFIMVDEYQDTNTAQFKLVSLLASRYKNLCVVGDDDQSIYRFRGANIGNILNFEQHFPEAKVIRLEQNYRSTQNILDAANEVICHNRGRKEKRLWTANGEGEKVNFCQFLSGFEEADYIAALIQNGVNRGKWNYGDCAILYRTNAQSRMFEEKFMMSNVPYRLVGGVNFYARKEIKDILAYLKTIANAEDDLAVRRIINVPRRGIGATTITRVQDFAYSHGASFYNTLRAASQIPGMGKSVTKLENFVHMIQTFRSKVEFLSVQALIKEVLDVTGYLADLQAEETEEAEDRIENIHELLNKAALYDENHAQASEEERSGLNGFLEEVALVADIDEVEENPDRVLMMTLHSAKGLEFPIVFMVGMEDGIFPGYMSISSDDPLEIEEERRLCYVGITRAKQHLYLTAARQRMVRGEMQYNRVSRFIGDIPAYLLARNGGEAPKRSQNVSSQTISSRSASFQRVSSPSGSSKSIPFGEQFRVKKADNLDYGVGDRVRHIKFGVGVVQKIEDGKRDYEVTVDFERVGVKKMFASFAKLVKVTE